MRLLGATTGFLAVFVCLTVSLCYRENRHVSFKSLCRDLPDSFLIDGWPRQRVVARIR